MLRRGIDEKTINAAVYETHGNPADVLHVESQPWPTPAADEVVVKMRAAPINPADLNQIEGKYPVRRGAAGDAGIRRRRNRCRVWRRRQRPNAVGALVILPHNVGTWRDAVAVKADESGRCACGNRACAGGDVENQSDDRVAIAARLCRSYNAAIG